MSYRHPRLATLTLAAPQSDDQQIANNQELYARWRASKDQTTSPPVLSLRDLAQKIATERGLTIGQAQLEAERILSNASKPKGKPMAAPVVDSRELSRQIAQNHNLPLDAAQRAADAFIRKATAKPVANPEPVPVSLLDLSRIIARREGLPIGAAQLRAEAMLRDPVRVAHYVRGELLNG